MIDTDRYEEQLEDDNTDTWVVWRIAKESIEEVKHLRKQLSKARNWVRDYFTDINGDYTSYENRTVHGDFIQQMEMEKNKGSEEE